MAGTLYFQCPECGQTHRSALEVSREDFQVALLEEREEFCPVEQRAVACLKPLVLWTAEPSTEPPAEVQVHLTWAEASAIVAMAENGSFAMRSARASATDKVRRALMLAGSDPHAHIKVICNPAEAQFLERTRTA
jgi:hypothetical protein